MDSDRPALPRKRRRPPKSCEQCRKRKVKCDQKLPCDQCTRLKFDNCSYDPQTLIGRENKRQVTTTDSVRIRAAHNPPPTPASTADTETVSRPADAQPGYPTYTVYQSPFTLAPENPVPTISIHQKPIELLEERLSRVLDHPSFPQPHSSSCAAANDSFGVITKTRLLGRSHWMYVIKQFRFIVDLKETLEAGNRDDVKASLNRCKILGRSIKNQIVSNLKVHTNVRDHLPSRDIADALVDNYFRAFESCHRILHVPSFKKEYAQFWNATSSASEIFVIKLLLVLAIGASVHSDVQSHTVHMSALQWINAAQFWLGSPFNEKSKIGISGVQIHCLLLVAREVNSVGPDLIWISAGALLRAAMLTGLHRDPSNFVRMNLKQSEIRRRLWATVLEICLQASMNAGGSPMMISIETHDCRPPSNFNDEDLDKDMNASPAPQTDNVFTQASLQIALMQTIQTRYKISQLLNDSPNEPPFQEVIQMGNTLRSTLHELSARLNRSQSESVSVAGQVSFMTYDLMTKRFLLSLFQDSAIKALTNPIYYYALKVSRDVSLEIAAATIPIPGRGTPPEDADFRRLIRFSSGTYRNVLMLAYLVISLELVSDLQKSRSGLSGPSSASDALLRSEYLRYLDEYTEYTLDRIKNGETNVKGYVFSATVLAHEKALIVGEPPESAAFDAARKGLDQVTEILQNRLYEVTPSQTTSPFDLQQPIDDFGMPFDGDFGWNEWDPANNFGMMDIFLQD